MNILMIKDLPVSEELDRKAMLGVRGGRKKLVTAVPPITPPDPHGGSGML